MITKNYTGIKILISCFFLVIICSFKMIAQVSIIDLDLRTYDTETVQKDVFGVNNFTSTRPYDMSNSGFISKYIDLGKPVMQYPGGTSANYLNLSTGFAEVWAGASATDSTRMNSINLGMANKGKTNGEDLDKYIDFLNATDAVSSFVLNITTMTALETTAVLDSIVAEGVSLDYVEVGNEVFYNAYETVIADVDAYITLAKARVDLVKLKFPTAKIGVVIPSYLFTSESFLETSESVGNRQIKWYNSLKSESFFDAVIVHLYSSVGMDNSVTTSNFLSFKQAYRHSISHVDGNLQDFMNTVEIDFPTKKVWVTEYHVGGFGGDVRNYRLRYSYLGGLFTANFMFKLFKNPLVEMSNWHSLVQMLTFSNPSGGGLLADTYEFGTTVNYEFLKMFKEPIKNSTYFVPVDFQNLDNYSGVGGYAQSYNDIEAGVFKDDISGKSYLMLFNKWESDYSIEKSVLEQKLGGSILKCTQLSIDDSLSEIAALESESSFSKKMIYASAGMYTVPKFSVQVYEFQNSDSFKTTWEISSANETLLYPIIGILNEEYRIDWGDGSAVEVFDGVQNNPTHQYQSPGIYTIVLGGKYAQFKLDNNSNIKEKLLFIEQWGTNSWLSMNRAFYGANNMIMNAIDAPVLSSVVDMNSMFSGASSFNGSIEKWDMSNVTSINYMFSNASSINRDINDWDTSNITNMVNVFSNAVSFNRDLSGWSMENVTNASGMFNGIAIGTLFYDKTLSSWAAQNVQAGVVFDGGNSTYCNASNQRIQLENNWMVTDGGQDCSGNTFVTTWNILSSNEQLVFPIKGITGEAYQIDWGDGSVVDIDSLGMDNPQHIYANIGVYTVSISGKYEQFIVDNNLDIKNKLLSVEQWGTNPWTSMKRAFFGAKNMVLNAVDIPDLSAVTNMNTMFSGATAFNGEIENWDISNVTSMNYTFGNATSFNRDISNWDTSNVSSMINVFSNASSFDQNLGTWNLEKVTNASGMFNGVVLSTINYDALLSALASQNIQPNVQFNGGYSAYCIAKDERTILTTAPNNWLITDGGLHIDCIPVAKEIINEKKSIAAVVEVDETEIKIYPNPVINELNIVGFNQVIDVYVFDLTGNLLLVKENLQDHRLDVSMLSMNIYIGGKRP